MNLPLGPMASPTASPFATGAPPPPDPLVITRRVFFWGYWSVLAVLLAGYMTNVRLNLSPNDQSRWDTIWSLVEFNTYQIFDTPEEAAKYGKPTQFKTIDKVVAPDGKTYSSKPPLLPTVMAGWIKGLRLIVGLPFTIDSRDENNKPVRGSIHLYGPITMMLFQGVPFFGALILYRRWLDRTATTTFGWVFCLLAAGLGTFVTGYLVTLDNHVIGASFGFMTAYLTWRITIDGKRDWWRYLLTGLCAGWTAANELPAGLLVVIVGVILLTTDVKKTLLGFLPPLLVVTAAFFWANHAAIGSFTPAYLIKSLKDYPNSYWRNPEKMSSIDALNFYPEPYWLYFINLTIGHHGLFSLTPLWLLVAWSAIEAARGRDPLFQRVRPLLLPVGIISAGVFLFYWLITTERNYGGYCHGARWLMWLSPIWLMLLPPAADRLTCCARGQRFAWACLLVSIYSMADTLYNPWSYSWLHHFLNRIGVVPY